MIRDENAAIMSHHVVVMSHAAEIGRRTNGKKRYRRIDEEHVFTLLEAFGNLRHKQHDRIYTRKP